MLQEIVSLGLVAPSDFSEILRDAQIVQAAADSALQQLRQDSMFERVLLSVSAVAAAGAAIISGWSVAISRRAARDAVRAYVLVESATLRKIPYLQDKENYEISVEVILKNTGNSPAFELAVAASFAFGDEGRIEGLTLPTSPSSIEVLGAGLTRTIHGEFAHSGIFPTDFNIQRKIDEGKTVWVKGVAQYHDLHAQWWELTFCWRLRDMRDLLNYPSSAEEASRVAKSFGMTVHRTKNGLRKIDGPRLGRPEASQHGEIELAPFLPES
jgi:hypothetical protein